MIQLWCWLKWSEKLFPRTSTTFLWIEAGDKIFTFNHVLKFIFRHCETTGTGAISMEIYQIIAYKKFIFKAFPTKSCASALGWGNLVETGGLILHRLWVTKQCCQTNLNTFKNGSERLASNQSKSTQAVLGKTVTMNGSTVFFAKKS